MQIYANRILFSAGITLQLIEIEIFSNENFTQLKNARGTVKIQLGI